MPRRLSIPLLLALLAVAAAPAPGARPAAADLAPRAAPSVTAAEIDTPWLDSLELALARSAVDYKPILLFATSEDCSHCLRMKQTTFRDPAVRKVLRQFVLLEIDVRRNRRLAGRLGIESTPTCLLLASDGRDLGRVAGYLAPEDLAGALQRVLAGDRTATTARESAAALLGWLDEGAPAATNRWSAVAEAMGDAALRGEVRARAARFPESARRRLADVLAAPSLAARMGALELLEEWAGDDHGFDPWLDAEGNREALRRWQQWAAATGSVPRADAALDEAEMDRRLQDVISGDRDRALRALRVLEGAGARAAPAIAAFAREQRELPPDAAGHLRELRYAVSLPVRTDIDPAVVAHRLVFGNLDGKLQSLRLLGTAGPDTLPLLREFLPDPSALVRAAALEALLRAGGRTAIPEVEQHLRGERDPEVIITAVKGLGALKSRTALAVMMPLAKHPEEDVVIATLESMAKLRSHEPREAIAAGLADGRWRVRATALKAVEELKLAALADAVAARLKDDDAYVRYAAVRAMPQVSPEKAGAVLESIFLSSDDLKGPVLEALQELSQPPTPRMIAALEKADPGVIVAALDVLGAREEGVQVPLRFAGHADLDVSCTALRALAPHVDERPDALACLARLLRQGRPEERLAVLDALIDSLYTVRKVLRIPAAAEAAVAAAGGEPGAVGEELFAAFGDEAAPATPSPAAVGEELFAAFGAGDGAGAAAGPSAEAGERVSPDRALLAALRDAAGATNALIRRSGIVLLAALGEREAAAAIVAELKELPEASRLQLAMQVEPRAGDTHTQELLTRLLDDRAAQVREAAAKQAFEWVRIPGIADALFTRMADPARGIKPSAVASWSLDEHLKPAAARTAVRPWAERWLREPPRPPLQVLAVVLLQHLWKQGDETLVEPLTRSESEFVRRAAYRALLTRPGALPDAYYAAAAADSSARVRLAVAANFQNDTWSHEFDETDSAYARQSFSYSSSRRAPGPAAQAALERLVGDSDPRVAMAGQIALLQSGRLQDPAALVRTLRMLPDASRALDQVSGAIRSHGKPLPALYPLLPLIEESALDDDEKIQLRALLTPAAVAGAVAATQAVAQAVAPAPPSAPPPAAPLRAILFVEHGCESCARVRVTLDQLRTAFPDLQLVEAEIVKVEAKDLNRELCDCFRAPSRVEGLTPALFAAAGYLAGEADLTQDRVVDLLARSAGRRFDYALRPPANVPPTGPEAESAEVAAVASPEPIEPVAEPLLDAAPRAPLVGAGLLGALAVVAAAWLRKRR